jgi:hypothetical protein
MAPKEFFGDVQLDGLSLAAYKRGKACIHDRYLLKDFLEYVHIKKGLLEAYGPDYPLVEPRELLPSFEKNFAEYKDLPSFSLAVFNRPLSYPEEIFQFDLLHPHFALRKKTGRETLDKIMPYLDRDLRPALRHCFAHRDLTDLAYYERIVEFLFHMDRGHVIARDSQGAFRLLGVYASFPSDLDTELKNFGHHLGKFKQQDPGAYERQRDFVYQFFMELYGFPISSERRTSAALFARKLSRLKEQYLIKVLGASDRTITSFCGYEQKQYPLVEKFALISLPPGLAEANPHLRARGFYVDPERRVVVLKVTYQQHKYNRFNVLEDRAMAVVKQEIIHPYHGRADASLNILKDTKRVLKELTDIVRGEHTGTISYKRTDLLASTKTHEDRLKFLSAWLTKNQRRIAAYSAESFEAAKKVLNSYLLNREYREAFAKYTNLHRELLQQVAYLTQAQQLQVLERLAQLEGQARGPAPAKRLAQALAFLEEKQRQLPYFYPDLFEKCVELWEQILAYPYFQKVASETAPPESPFRRRVWQMLVRGQLLVAQLKEQHRRVLTEVGRGVPLPLLPPEPRPSPAKR